MQAALDAELAHAVGKLRLTGNKAGIGQRFGNRPDALAFLDGYLHFLAFGKLCGARAAAHENHDADDDGDPRAVHDAGQGVPAEGVRAQPVGGAGALQQGGIVQRVAVIGGENAGEDRDEEEEEKADEAKDDQTAAEHRLEEALRLFPAELLFQRLSFLCKIHVPTSLFL